MIDVQKLAREAGFEVHERKKEVRVGLDALLGINSTAKLERFAALVLEEAAKVCDDISIEAAKQWKERYRPFDQGREHGADECAEAIRALKPAQTQD